MIMQKPDLKAIQDQCIIAARKAGALIMQRRGSALTVDNKIDLAGYQDVGESLASQVVTEVDHNSQACILASLSPVLQQYDLALLTEESEDDSSRFRKDYFICIDPLDGTLPFTEGKAGFSVVIALVSKQGVPLLGVVYDPCHEVLYTAIKGEGALCNGVPFNVKSQKVQAAQSPSLTLLTDRSFLSQPRYTAIMACVNNIAQAQGCRDVQTLTQAGAALNACWVVERAPALYFKYPKPALGGGSIWDFAASACIASEAGASVSNIAGKPLDLNRQDSSFMNHEGVLFASSDSLAQAVIEISRVAIFD